MNSFFLADKYKKSISQLIRYGVVGLTINFAGYMVYLLLTYLGVTPKLAMSVLYGVGVAASFWGNRVVTFSHKGGIMSSGARFLIAHCFGYLINLTLLIVFVDNLGYPHQLVQVIAIFIVAAFLFMIFKLFVFVNDKASNTESI